MAGTMVITSKENFKIPAGVTQARIEVRKNDILWFFDTPPQAAEASKAFADSGVEYVYRP
jgi:hypothetical protein